MMHESVSFLHIRRVYRCEFSNAESDLMIDALCRDGTGLCSLKKASKLGVPEHIGLLKHLTALP